MDGSPPGFSVHGILQTRTLEWVVISSSRGSSWLRDWTHISYVSCIGRWVLYRGAMVEAPNCNNCIYPLQLRWFPRLLRRESTEMKLTLAWDTSPSCSQEHFLLTLHLLSEHKYCKMVRQQGFIERPPVPHKMTLHSFCNLRHLLL